MVNADKGQFKFPQMSMGEFFDRLRSADFPNPTGGAAAMVSAMAGANLLVMVLNLNLDGEEDPERVNELMVVIQKLEEITESVWDLMERDIANLDRTLQLMREAATNGDMDVAGCESCATLLQAVEKIAAITGFIPLVLRLNHKTSLVCDLGTAYWLLDASAKALGALFRYNLAKLNDESSRANFEARYEGYYQAIHDLAHHNFYVH